MYHVVKDLIVDEINRQESTIGLIASENTPSQAVRDAVGSVFMHKYSEGYPFARYYEGNSFVDSLESITQKEILKLFKLSQEDWHANVQPLSGSIANLAVYNAVLQPNDTILSMYLPDGGHLSHGWSYSQNTDTNSKNSEMIYRGGERKVNIVSKFYNVVQYKTNPETFLFDYDEIKKVALEVKPKLIVTGGTAYPRDIDYERMMKIAKKVGAFYLADVAHEAGLIAGNAVPAPFTFADFVTFTTHKTFRGPRGAVILSKKEFSKEIDRSVFPGMQGGPFNHTIAGILQATLEAQSAEFSIYAKQVVTNAQVLSEELSKLGFKITTGGTDKHLLLIDLRNTDTNGSEFASSLAEYGIITNKNSVPWDTASPSNPSGLRIGTPLVTTRGMKEPEMKVIAQLIKAVFDGDADGVPLSVQVLCKKFPLYK